jgi:hypothetical protein
MTAAFTRRSKGMECWKPCEVRDIYRKKGLDPWLECVLCKLEEDLVRHTPLTHEEINHTSTLAVFESLGGSDPMIVVKTYIRLGLQHGHDLRPLVAQISQQVHTKK